MPHHEQLFRDPLGALRRLWSDVGWRTVLIASFLLFWLEALMFWAGPDVDTAVWLAMTISLVLIGRLLAQPTLAGDLRDSANMTVLLGIITISIAEIAAPFSGASAWLAVQTIFWPFSLIVIFCLVLSRLLAPVISQPLNVFAALFLFFVFWLNAADWLARPSVPEYSEYLRWSVAYTAFALIALGIAGRGFGGSVASPLNLAALLTIFGVLWVEVGMFYGGSGEDFAEKGLAWPWLLLIMGTALLARLSAPYLSRYLTAGARNGGDG